MKKWYYNKEADLTIGEQPIPKAAKIILIILLISLVVSSILALYFREYVYDYIVDPGLVITAPKNLSVNIGDDLDVKGLVLPDLERLEVEYPDKPDTTKPGKYELVYKVSNHVNEKEYKVNVEVKDTEAPKIELKNDVVVLTRDEDKLNADEQVKSVTDNLDKDLKVTHNADELDMDKDLGEVKYKAKDSSGNIGTTTLKVVIKDKEKEPEVKVVEKIVEKPVVQQSRPQPTPQRPQPRQTQPQQPRQQSKPRTPYINGVRNITVPVGTSPQALGQKLSSGITSSGYVSLNFSSVNLTVPGQYKVTYNSNDGVNKSCIVTVTE